jgi:L-alanine-DL-glutamate epimerase-like enolase superfamily enzyme
MKIADVEAIALAVPMSEKIAAPIPMPRADEVSEVVFKEYRTTMVRITTDDGITGVGECMTRLSGTSLRDIVHYIKPVLIGRDPRDIESIWDLMWSIMMNRGHVKGFYQEAMAGIDTALWDIFGKSLSVPVWRLLGGRTNPRIWCYASSLRLRSIDILRDEIDKHKANGFNAMKFKIGKDPMNWRDEVKIVEQIRAHAGDKITLMSDVNCNYSRDLKTALEVGKALEALGVYWYEEPLAPDDVDGYAYLKDKLNIRIATGEADFNKYSFARFFKRDAIDIVQHDAARSAGITESRKIADMADAFRVAYAPHNGSSSNIIMTVSLHLATYAPNFLIYEYMQSDWNKAQRNPLRWDLCQMPIKEFKDSHIVLEEKPGLGIEINEEVVERYRLP